MRDRATPGSGARASSFPRDQVGRAGEERAAAWLEERGYRVLARNWRARHAELDVVAAKDGVVCFVEVRVRGPGARGTALASVDARKRAHLAAAAQDFLLKKRLTGRRARFDVVAIEADGSLTHVEGAFTL